MRQKTEPLKPFPKSYKRILEQSRIDATIRRALERLMDGKVEAFAPLYFIKHNYKQWQKIFCYLERNNLRGEKLLDFFKNESADGGGYHSGVSFILARIEGHKNSVPIIKSDQLS